MMKVLEVAEAKEGRLMELDVRNAGMSQESVEDCKDINRRLYQVLIACTKGEAKNYVGSQSGLTSRRPKTLQSARNTVQTWKQDVAEFEMKYFKKVDEDAKNLVIEVNHGQKHCSEKQVCSEEGRSTYTRACVQPSSTIWMTKCQCQ